MRFLVPLLALTSLAHAQPTLNVLWDRSGEGAQSHFGAAVFSLGDQNDDGFADWAVLSSGSGIPGQINEPRFDLFRGGEPPSDTPYLTFTGRLSPYRELWNCQILGDVNGDGYVDWWTQYGFGPQDDSVVVEFHWGGPNTDTIPDFVWGYSADNGLSRAGSLGDINGDGYDDLYLYRGGEGHNETYLFFGNNPLDTIADLIIQYNPPCSSQPVAYGDINGDEYSDFVATTNFVNPSTCFYLGGHPPDTIPDYVWPDFRVDRLTLDADLNGDLRADLVVGRSLRMDVHFGGPTLSPTPDYTLNFGNCDIGPTRMASAGDLNGDGYGDLAATSQDCALGGRLQIYLGHPWLNPDPVITLDDFEPPLGLQGINMAVGLGDVNGDGINDLGLGATDGELGRRGRMVVLSGDTTLRVGAEELQPELPQELSVSVFPNPFNSETTVLLDLPVYANEVELTAYNLLGQTVQQATLRNVNGQVRYRFDAAALSSGVYLLRASAGVMQTSQKLVVLK